jgi:hypothetical protein
LSRAELNVELSELYRPLDDATVGITVVVDLS